MTPDAPEVPDQYAVMRAFRALDPSELQAANDIDPADPLHGVDSDVAAAAHAQIVFAHPSDFAFEMTPDLWRRILDERQRLGRWLDEHDIARLLGLQLKRYPGGVFAIEACPTGASSLRRARSSELAREEVLEFCGGWFGQLERHPAEALVPQPDSEAATDASTDFE